MKQINYLEKATFLRAGVFGGKSNDQRARMRVRSHRIPHESRASARTTAILRAPAALISSSGSLGSTYW
jgi:hypothetical protein